MKVIYCLPDHEQAFTQYEDALAASGFRARDVRELPVYENYDEYADEKNHEVRVAALAKLTDNEKRLLGLTFSEKEDEEPKKLAGDVFGRSTEVCTTMPDLVELERQGFSPGLWQPACPGSLTLDSGLCFAYGQALRRWRKDGDPRTFYEAGETKLAVSLEGMEILSPTIASRAFPANSNLFADLCEWLKTPAVTAVPDSVYALARLIHKLRGVGGFSPELTDALRGDRFGRVLLVTTPGSIGEPHGG